MRMTAVEELQQATWNNKARQERLCLHQSKVAKVSFQDILDSVL